MSGAAMMSGWLGTKYGIAQQNATSERLRTEAGARLANAQADRVQNPYVSPSEKAQAELANAQAANLKENSGADSVLSQLLGASLDTLGIPAPGAGLGGGMPKRPGTTTQTISIGPTSPFAIGMPGGGLSTPTRAGTPLSTPALAPAPVSAPGGVPSTQPKAVDDLYGHLYGKPGYASGTANVQPTAPVDNRTTQQKAEDAAKAGAAVGTATGGPMFKAFGFMRDLNDVATKLGFAAGTESVPAKNFATGTSKVPGKGSPAVDTVDAKLAPGEAVLNQPAANMMGRGLIAALNKLGAQQLGLA